MKTIKTDFTLVVGIDKRHLQQLKTVWPTWMKHKPSLQERRLIVFYDWESVTSTDILQLIRFLGHPQIDCYPWPPGNYSFNEHCPGDGDKWSNPQRHKMLAGFVHIPADQVITPYWMKLDTDTVATGNDGWIEQDWFFDHPAIVSHSWRYTKPPDQMLVLDRWAENHCPTEFPTGPLNLAPNNGSPVLRHQRIISWCAFFETAFTRICSRLAWSTMEGPCLPVASQDGFMWYVAKRLQREIRTVSMKARGWQHWTTDANIFKAVQEALA